MKTLKWMLMLSLVFVCLITFSQQSLYAQAGGSSVPFLLISPDARTSGMGEAGTAMTNDINAVYWNSAGLAFLDYFPKINEYDEYEEEKPFRQVALSFSPWLPQFNADLFYSYGAVGQYFEKLQGTVALNFIFMNLGEFTRTWDNGDVLGKFISNEFALSLAYGTIVAPDLGVGAQLRYIQSNLTPTSFSQQDAGTGRSIAFDLGILWRPKELPYIDDRLSLGFNLKNVGPKITYIKEADPLPTTLNLGIGMKAYQDEFHKLVFSADFNKLLVKRDSVDSDPVPKSFITAWENPGAVIAFGTEYTYEDVIALRAGYFHEPSVLGDRQYWNFGAGVKYSIFTLDFSFINTIEANHPLANTMRFSMLIDWK
ncbi:MAG: hypothetical protein A2X64_03215 [Ignavibacteria bacterium GWF2_33_9]|nr:MAG: hypothetical protein A2X64_03215 [Ignavibacteria bacterium GWF2_33_9]